jgi:hypothetical protein
MQRSVLNFDLPLHANCLNVPIINVLDVILFFLSVQHADQMDTRNAYLDLKTTLAFPELVLVFDYCTPVTLTATDYVARQFGRLIFLQMQLLADHVDLQNL